MDVKVKQGALAGALLMFMGLITPAWAIDMMLLIPEIPGQSEFFPGGITVNSYTHGADLAVSTSGGTGGAGTGKVSLAPLVIEKPIGPESPQLYKYCCSGKHLARVDLFARKATDSGVGILYNITMEDVLVTSCRTSASDETLGAESITFTYAKISASFSGATDNAGKPLPPSSFSWNLATNTP